MSFYKEIKSCVEIINDSKRKSKNQKEENKLEKELTKANLKRVTNYLKPVIVAIIFYFIFGLTNVGVNVLFPLNEAKLFNNITLLNFAGIKVNILYMAAIYIVSIITITVQSFVYHHYIKFKVTNGIKKDMCKQILNITNESFDKNQTGTFIARLNGDADTIVDTLDRISGNSATLFASLGVFVAAFFINWKIGIIYLLQSVALIWINSTREASLLPLRKERKLAAEKLRSIITEMIRGVRDIKNLNIKNEYTKRVNQKIDDNDTKFIAIMTARRFYESLLTTFRLLAYLGLFVVGVHDIKAGLLTAADLITLYLYAGRCMTVAITIASIQKEWNDLTLSLNKVFSFEDEKEFPKDKFGTRYIGDIKGKISFKGVTFGYNDEERVLKDISFDVKEKSNVAFVGESGAGKTTILSLLTKNYTIDNHGKGHIYIDDIDINEFSEKSFRSIISYIPQMPYIFNMSIKDNLLLVKENATNEEIDDALKKACLLDYVETLPDKKDTIIGEGGINLSGGQRQRLAIARSLLKDCKILILDEATSALDNITQNEIKNVINNLANKYTVITIAHRLSTIKEADEIFVLNNGKIEANGTHEELLENPIYSRLYAGEIE